jgi:hypothetical protein
MMIHLSKSPLKPSSFPPGSFISTTSTSFILVDSANGLFLEFYFYFFNCNFVTVPLVFDVHKKCYVNL